jgi:hypothetical protein
MECTEPFFGMRWAFLAGDLKKITVLRIEIRSFLEAEGFNPQW